MRVQIAVLLVTTAALSTSCASPALTGIPNTWPHNWPRLEWLPQGQCPNISGTYDDFGRSVLAHAESRRLSLSYRLTQFYILGNANTRVEIAQTGNEELRVLVIDGSETRVDRVLTRRSGDFECDLEGLWTKPVVETDADGTGYARSSMSVGFRAAEGGVLAGQERNRIFGLALWVVPVPGTQNIWFRWDPSK